MGHESADQSERNATSFLPHLLKGSVLPYSRAMANSVEEIQQSDRRISNGVGTTVIGAGAFLATLDLFIVNVAFPDIRASFPGTTTQDLSWVLTAYGILFAALLVPAGRLADVYGLRRMFRTGLAVFAVASAACAAAPSVGLLVAGRAVQACGAALIVPTSLGLMLATYPAERHRHAVGLWAAIGGVAAACGPPIGGLLGTLTLALDRSLKTHQERLLDLAPRDAFEDGNIGVNVDFVPHGENLSREWPILPLKSLRPVLA